MLLTSSWISDLILFIITTGFLAYIYSTRHFNHWRKRNVFFLKPLPFFGNFKDVVTMKTTIAEWLRGIYNTTKEPFFGLWVFDEPCLVVKDPLLIKQILITDFNVFTDRTIAWPEHDSIAKHQLFSLPNPQWKPTRAKMSPTFTSGKLKTMFPTIKKVGERLSTYLHDHQGILDAKEVIARYTTDVIAKIFFGIDANCLENENAFFRQLGKGTFDFTLRNAFVTTAYFSMPNLVRWFKLDLVPGWIRDHFCTIFMEAFEAREKTNDRMNDFIDILKDLKKKEEQSGEFETLRKYPVVPFLDRRCLKDYKLPGTDVVIGKGTRIFVPLFALHYDEKYFPEPEKYEPERFDNKNYNSNGLVYMPFGEGPRTCIGERLGLLSTKLGLITILSKFEVEKCKTTPNSIQFEPKSQVLASKIGLPMKFKYLVTSST